MVHLCTHVCLVMHVCVYAPVIDDACGACMYIYAHMFLVVHVVHVCTYGTCMCI